jgi:hypothetical protein
VPIHYSPIVIEVTVIFTKTKLSRVASLSLEFQLRSRMHQAMLHVKSVTILYRGFIILRYTPCLRRNEASAHHSPRAREVLIKEPVRLELLPHACLLVGRLAVIDTRL